MSDFENKNSVVPVVDEEPITLGNLTPALREPSRL